MMDSKFFILLLALNLNIYNSLPTYVLSPKYKCIEGAIPILCGRPVPVSDPLLEEEKPFNPEGLKEMNIYKNCQEDEKCINTFIGYQCIKLLSLKKVDEYCDYNRECFSDYCNNHKCKRITGYNIDERHYKACKIGYTLTDANGKKACLQITSGENEICGYNGKECHELFTCDYTDNKCKKKGGLTTGKVVGAFQQSAYYTIINSAEKFNYKIGMTEVCESDYGAEDPEDEKYRIKCVTITKAGECTKNGDSYYCTATIGFETKSYDISMECSHITYKETEVQLCPVVKGISNAFIEYSSKLSTLDKNVFYDEELVSRNLIPKDIVESYLKYYYYYLFTTQGIMDESLDIKDKCTFSYLVNKYSSTSNSPNSTSS